MTHPDELPDHEVWETSDGVRIPLKDMGETHLRNATNYMRRTIADSNNETEMEDIAEKLDKLEGEVERRLNTERPSPKSLPITKARQEAEDNYRRLKE